MVLAALLSLFGSMAVAVSAASANPPGNWSPVTSGDFPDPSVLSYGGSYYAFSTQSTPQQPGQAQINIQEATSPNGVTWTKLGQDALPTVGAWAKPGDTWAPSVAYNGSTFVMYYTATESQSPGYQCIGVATSPTPLGPYRDTSPQPMVCQDGTGWGAPTIMGSASYGGSIDPDIFKDSSGQSWLLWKNDGNRVGQPTTIWSVPLTSDLMAPASSSGTPLLTDSPGTWEGSVIEGPFMYETEITSGPTKTDSYYLFFSANVVASTAYGVGWASCPAGPAGPCTDQTALSGPILSTAPGMSGPGGPALFTVPGQTATQATLAVAGWQGGTIGYSNCGIRPMYEADVSFTGAGSPPAPVLTDPNPNVTPAVGPTCPAPPPQPPPGYWQVASDGGVFTFGAAHFYGSTGSMRLNKPVVGMAATPDGKGYWLVASDGGIFAYGDAQFYGSTGSMVLNKPIIGMIPTLNGGGYWLIASDGGVFAFGNAPFYGSTGGSAPPYPITAAAPSFLSGGYWMVDSNGQVFNFGNAPAEGSPSSAPGGYTISGIAPTHNDNGYWLSSWNGNVAGFGNAAGYGSMYGTNLNAPIIGITATNDGAGYWLQGADGGIFTFGDAPFLGSMGGQHLNAPMVGITSM